MNVFDCFRESHAQAFCGTIPFDEAPLWMPNLQALRKAKQAEFDTEAADRRKKAAEAYAAFRAAKVVADAKFKATVEAESAKVRSFTDATAVAQAGALFPHRAYVFNLTVSFSLQKQSAVQAVSFVGGPRRCCDPRGHLGC